MRWMFPSQTHCTCVMNVSVMSATGIRVSVFQLCQLSLYHVGLHFFVDSSSSPRLLALIYSD